MNAVPNEYLRNNNPVNNKIINFEKLHLNNTSDISQDNDSNTSYTFNTQGGDDMDDMLKMYIEKMAQDQESLRTDIRESERRTSESIQKVEERMDKRLEKIEKITYEQNKKMDGIKDDLQTASIERSRFWIGMGISILGILISTIFSIISLVQ